MIPDGCAMVAFFPGLVCLKEASLHPTLPGAVQSASHRSQAGLTSLHTLW
jgi:hypothetical protein